MTEHRTPPISVVVACHHGRQRSSLVAAAAALANQSIRPTEIIVAVDRNPELHRWARRALPGVTVLANQRQPGASGNRNTGAWYARTPLVAFLDGDALPHPGWLAGLVAPLADPAVAGTGGPIRPAWEQPRPGWFPDEFLWAVGGSPPGLPAAPVPVRNVWSASMAVRRSAFLAAGGFREGFGKLGDRSRPEDTDLCLRMGRTGQWIFTPEAAVEHPVASHQSTFPHFLRRCYHEGRGKVALARLLDGQDSLGTERDYLRRTLPRAVRAGLARSLRGGGTDHATRAGAILAGVAAAATGGAIESLSSRPARPAPTPLPSGAA